MIIASDISNITAPIVVEFATRDMSTTNLVLAFGGTASGQVYTWPTAPDNIREKSLVLKTEIVNDTYFKIEIGTALLTAGADNPMVRLSPETGQLQFSFKVMKSLSGTGSLAPPMKMTSV